MRWWVWIVILVAVLGLAGCSGNRDEAPVTPAISIVTFRYDAVRDVVLANTSTLQPLRASAPDYAVIAGTPPNTPTSPTTPPGTIPQPRTLTPQLITRQQYADALARLQDVSYTPSASIRLANPQATVANNVITVNYRDATGLDGLSSAQLAAVMASLEAWWWVPGVTEVRLLVRGQPLTTLGPATITQPLTRTYHTYVVQPLTGEVGYLIGSLNPTNLTQAVETLRSRSIRDFPASQGFRPLLPADVTLAVQTDRFTDGILPADLSTNFPLVNRMQLAGVVLMLTQFPQADAVRFTFGGQTINQPFMRTNLNVPITAYDLQLPLSVSTAATPRIQAALQQAATAALGAQPAAFGTGLVWQDWALLSVTPGQDKAAQLFVFRREGDTYTVQAFGATLPMAQLIKQGMPPEAITALRLPGWELVE